MSDKDRIALILDVLRDSDKVKKNAAVLQTAIAEHEAAKDAALKAKNEAQGVISQANAVKAQIFAESKALEDKQKIHADAVEKLAQERSAFEEEKKAHAAKVATHENNVKDHNANVQRLGVDKLAHEQSVKDRLAIAQKIEDDARKSILVSDQKTSEALALKKEYEDMIEKLSGIVSKK